MSSEEMSRAKAKVEAIYPCVRIWPPSGNGINPPWRIAAQIDGEAGWTVIGYGSDVGPAWIDAASRLPAEPKVEPVERDETRVCPTCILVNGLHHPVCKTAKDYWDQQKDKEAEGGTMKKQRRREMEDVSTVYQGTEGGGVEHLAPEQGFTFDHLDGCPCTSWHKECSSDCPRCNCGVEPKEAAPEAARQQEGATADIRRSISAAHNLINDWHDIRYGERAVEAQDILVEVIGELMLLDSSVLTAPEPATEGAPETVRRCVVCGVPYEGSYNRPCAHCAEPKAEGADKVSSIAGINGNYVLLEDYQKLESRNAELAANYQTLLDDAVDMRSENSRLSGEIEECKNKNREFNKLCDKLSGLVDEACDKGEKAERDVQRLTQQSANVSFNEGVDAAIAFIAGGRFLSNEAPTAQFAREVAENLPRIKRVESSPSGQKEGE